MPKSPSISENVRRSVRARKKGYNRSAEPVASDIESESTSSNTDSSICQIRKNAPKVDGRCAKVRKKNLIPLTKFAKRTNAGEHLSQLQESIANDTTTEKCPAVSNSPQRSPKLKDRLGSPIQKSVLSEEVIDDQPKSDANNINSDDILLEINFGNRCDIDFQKSLSHLHFTDIKQDIQESVASILSIDPVHSKFSFVIDYDPEVVLPFGLQIRSPCSKSQEEETKGGFGIDSESIPRPPALTQEANECQKTFDQFAEKSDVAKFLEKHACEAAVFLDKAQLIPLPSTNLSTLPDLTIAADCHESPQKSRVLSKKAKGNATISVPTTDEVDVNLLSSMQFPDSMKSSHDKTLSRQLSNTHKLPKETEEKDLHRQNNIEPIHTTTAQSNISPIVLIQPLPISVRLKAFESEIFNGIGKFKFEVANVNKLDFQNNSCNHLVESESAQLTPAADINLSKQQLNGNASDSLDMVSEIKTNDLGQMVPVNGMSIYSGTSMGGNDFNSHSSSELLNDTLDDALLVLSNNAGMGQTMMDTAVSMIATDSRVQSDSSNGSDGSSMDYNSNYMKFLGDTVNMHSTSPLREGAVDAERKTSSDNLLKEKPVNDHISNISQDSTTTFQNSDCNFNMAKSNVKSHTESKNTIIEFLRKKSWENLTVSENTPSESSKASNYGHESLLVKPSLTSSPKKCNGTVETVNHLKQEEFEDIIYGADVFEELKNEPLRRRKTKRNIKVKATSMNDCNNLSGSVSDKFVSTPTEMEMSDIEYKSEQKLSQFGKRQVSEIAGFKRKGITRKKNEEITDTQHVLPSSKSRYESSIDANGKTLNEILQIVLEDRKQCHKSKRRNSVKSTTNENRGTGSNRTRSNIDSISNICSASSDVNSSPALSSGALEKYQESASEIKESQTTDSSDKNVLITKLRTSDQCPLMPIDPSSERPIVMSMTNDTDSTFSSHHSSYTEDTNVNSTTCISNAIPPTNTFSPAVIEEVDDNKKKCPKPSGQISIRETTLSPKSVRNKRKMTKAFDERDKVGREKSVIAKESVSLQKREPEGTLKCKTSSQTQEKKSGEFGTSENTSTLVNKAVSPIKKNLPDPVQHKCSEESDIGEPVMTGSLIEDTKSTKYQKFASSDTNPLLDTISTTPSASNNAVILSPNKTPGVFEFKGNLIHEKSQFSELYCNFGKSDHGRYNPYVDMTMNNFYYPRYKKKLEKIDDEIIADIHNDPNVEGCSDTNSLDVTTPLSSETSNEPIQSKPLKCSVSKNSKDFTNRIAERSPEDISELPCNNALSTSVKTVSLMQTSMSSYFSSVTKKSHIDESVVTQQNNSGEAQAKHAGKVPEKQAIRLNKKTANNLQQKSPISSHSPQTKLDKNSVDTSNKKMQELDPQNEKKIQQEKTELDFLQITEHDSHHEPQKVLHSKEQKSVSQKVKHKSLEKTVLKSPEKTVCKSKVKRADNASQKTVQDDLSKLQKKSKPSQKSLSKSNEKVFAKSQKGNSTTSPGKAPQETFEEAFFKSPEKTNRSKTKIQETFKEALLKSPEKTNRSKPKIQETFEEALLRSPEKTNRSKTKIQEEGFFKSPEKPNRSKTKRQDTFEEALLKSPEKTNRPKTKIQIDSPSKVASKKYASPKKCSKKSPEKNTSLSKNLHKLEKLDSFMKQFVGNIEAISSEETKGNTLHNGNSKVLMDKTSKIKHYSKDSIETKSADRVNKDESLKIKSPQKKNHTHSNYDLPIGIDSKKYDDTEQRNNSCEKLSVLPIGVPSLLDDELDYEPEELQIQNLILDENSETFDGVLAAIEKLHRSDSPLISSQIRSDCAINSVTSNIEQIKDSSEPVIAPLVVPENKPNAEVCVEETEVSHFADVTCENEGSSTIQPLSMSTPTADETEINDDSTTFPFKPTDIIASPYKNRVRPNLYYEDIEDTETEDEGERSFKRRKTSSSIHSMFKPLSLPQWPKTEVLKAATFDDLDCVESKTDDSGAIELAVNAGSEHIEHLSETEFQCNFQNDEYFPENSKHPHAHASRLDSPVEKVSEHDSSLLSFIEKACEDGICNIAFKDLYEQIRNVSVKEQKQIIKVLLTAGVKYDGTDILSNVYDLLLKAKLFSSPFCSDFILICKSKARETDGIIKKVFNKCEKYKIPITEEALSTLYDFYCLDRSSWAFTVQLMQYSVVVCNYKTLDLRLLEDILLSVCKLGDYKSETKFLLLPLVTTLERLDKSSFRDLSKVRLEEFVGFLKSKSVYADYVNRLCNKISKCFPVQQPFSNHQPELCSPDDPKIKSIVDYVDEHNWMEVVDLFKLSIGSPTLSGLHSFHSCLLSDIEKMCSRFEAFISNLARGENNLFELPMDEFIFVACLGTSLMIEAHSKSQMKEAFGIVQLLQWYEIDYFNVHKLLLKGGFFNNEGRSEVSQLNFLSPFQVALTTVEVFLQCGAPDKAFSILKGHAWIPVEGAVDKRFAENYVWRIRVLLNLCKSLQIKAMLQEGVETLTFLLETIQQEADDRLRKAVQPLYEDISCCWNMYLSELLNSNKLTIADNLYSFRKGNGFLDVHASILRVFVMCGTDTNFNEKSKEYFTYGVFSGIYRIPNPKDTSSPHQLILLTCFSKTEFYLIVSCFLDKLFEISQNKKLEIDLKKWYSLKLLLVETPIENIPVLKAIDGINCSLEEARQRIFIALAEIGLIRDKNAEKAPDVIFVTPASIYKAFIHWYQMKNNHSPGSSSKHKTSPTQEDLCVAKCNGFKWQRSTSYSAFTKEIAEAQDNSGRTEQNKTPVKMLKEQSLFTSPPKQRRESVPSTPLDSDESQYEDSICGETTLLEDTKHSPVLRACATVRKSLYLKHSRIERHDKKFKRRKMHNHHYPVPKMFREADLNILIQSDGSKRTVVKDDTSSTNKSVTNSASPSASPNDNFKSPLHSVLQEQQGEKSHLKKTSPSAAVRPMTQVINPMTPKKLSKMGSNLQVTCVTTQNVTPLVMNVNPSETNSLTVPSASALTNCPITEPKSNHRRINRTALHRTLVVPPKQELSAASVNLPSQGSPTVFRVTFRADNEVRSRDISKDRNHNLVERESMVFTGESKKIHQFLLTKVNYKYKQMPQTERDTKAIQLTQQFMKESNLSDSNTICKAAYKRLNAFAEGNV